MADSANAKPRVLLSILRGEGFDMLGDTTDLFTTIQAGFGKFECERVLKPSGVELMNLAQSAIIEIIVQKRDKDGGDPRMLFRGRVPLANLHPSFFGNLPDANGNGYIEPQIWESWLGLFSAEVSMKDKTQDRIFQQCIEMGRCADRSSPRLFLRLQYLQAGANAPPRIAPTATNIGSASGLGPGGSIGPEAMRSELNAVHQAGSITPKVFSTGGMLAPPTDALAGSRALPAHPLPPTAGSSESVQRRNSPANQGSPLPAGEATGVPGVPPAWMSRGSMSLRGASPASGPVVAPPVRPGSPQAVGTPLLAGPARNNLNAAPGHSSPKSWQRPRSNSGHDAANETSSTVVGGVNWREKFEELRMEAGEKTFANEQVIVDLRSRNELVETEAGDLRQMVANLRLANEELEQQNLRLHGQDASREDTLKLFFEQVSPTLASLGWPLPNQPTEGASTAEASTAQLAQISTALADTLKARGSPNADADASSSLAAQELDLLGEAVWQAVEGGDATFEDWFSQQLDAAARARLATATRLLSACRRAAALRTAAAATETASEELPPAVLLTGPLYVPVKTDPVDLLVAASLLKLTTHPVAGSAATNAAAGLLRLESGKYRLGPDGPHISCYIKSGSVFVQVPSGNSNEAQHEAMELGDFLARGRNTPED